jgi:DNA-binding GntR family transcriptional regulator
VTGVSVPSTERISLGETAYQHLRAEIVSCRLAPGERLTERSLAESTGFGISPIRDALTRLDHDGLVRTLPRKGYQVMPLTLKSVDDLFTLWGIVGPEIARLGVRDANPERRQRAIDAFVALAELNRGEPSADRDAALRLVDQAAEAFAILAEATENEYLISIYQRLQSDMARVWALISEADPSVPDVAIDEDWPGVLTRRDGNAAAAYVEAYVKESHRRILRILSRWPSVVSSEIISLRG